MKLDNNLLNLLLNKEPVRFIAQPDKEGFSKAVTVSPTSHLYLLEKINTLGPRNYTTSNDVILDGVNREYKAIMDYLNVNLYEAM